MTAEVRGKRRFDGHLGLPLGARAGVEPLGVVRAGASDELATERAVFGPDDAEERNLLALLDEPLRDGEPRLHDGIEGVVEDGRVVEPVG